MRDFKLERAPQLIMKQKCWYLTYSHTVGGEDNTYALKVRVGWDGEKWDNFEFIRYKFGSEVDLITQEEIDHRYNTIVQYEGEQAASDWLEKSLFTLIDQIRGIEVDIREALIRRWNAMRELVNFHITM